MTPDVVPSDPRRPDGTYGRMQEPPIYPAENNVRPTTQLQKSR